MYPGTNHFLRGVGQVREEDVSVLSDTGERLAVGQGGEPHVGEGVPPVDPSGVNGAQRAVRPSAMDDNRSVV